MSSDLGTDEKSIRARQYAAAIESGEERFWWQVQRLVDLPTDRDRQEHLQRIENYHDKHLQARVPAEGPRVLMHGLAHKIRLAVWAQMRRSPDDEYIGTPVAAMAEQRQASLL